MDAFESLLPHEFFQIGGFSAPEHLDALIREPLEKTGQSEPRPVQFWSGYTPIQTLPSAKADDIKRIMLLEIYVNEVKYRKIKNRHFEIINQNMDYDKPSYDARI
jgi:hypothetical protein